MFALCLISLCVAVLGLSDSENSTLSVVPTVTTGTKGTTVVSTETPTAAVTTVTQATTTTLPSAPNTYTFYTSNNDGSVCIIARMGTRFVLNITTEYSVDLHMDNNSTNVTGSCGSSKQVMNITFTNNKQQWWMSLEFSNQNDKYSLASVTVFYFAATSIANITENVKAPIGHSYACKDVLVTNFQPNSLISVNFSEFQVEAFKKGSYSSEFSEATHCASDNSDVSQLVPIIVGAALAALVIIVLIAYLIGRARNKRAGYESV